MKLNYIKLSKTMYKFFYDENGRYGEFLIELKPLIEGNLIHSYGNAELFMKHPEYGQDLLLGLSEALDPVDTSKIDINEGREQVT